MPASDHDLVIAHQIAEEVRGLTARRRTWRKVSSLLDSFGVYRLTSSARERIAEALREAGLELEPSMLEVERYGTVRLSLAEQGRAAEPDSAEARLRAVEGVLSALLWIPARPPTPIALMELGDAPEDGLIWLNVDGARADAASLGLALRTLCGSDVTQELVDDLLTADEFPRTRTSGAVRLASAFDVVPLESEADADDKDASKTGKLVFQPVEFLVSERWLVTCWHGEDAARPDELVENVVGRWQTDVYETAGDLALLVLHELADTYTRARRQLYAWLESWELDFYRRHHRVEVQTLTDLRHLIAEFRKQLAELQRSGIQANRELIWFPYVTNFHEAERVDDIIDRALNDLRALSEALLASINLVATMTAARQSQLSERFQQLATAAVAVVLLPGLVATIYGANTRVPGEHEWSGFVVMVGLMIVTAVATVIALQWWWARETEADTEPVELPSVQPSPADASSTETDRAVIDLYEHLATDPHSRSPVILRIFTRSALLTPEDIGQALASSNGGVPMTKEQTRAVLRNLSRAQGNLLRAKRLSREVLVKDFDDYERTGSGRYGLSPADRDLLARHLADRRQPGDTGTRQ